MSSSRKSAVLLSALLSLAPFALAGAAEAPKTEIKGAAILDHPCGKIAVKQMGLIHAGKFEEANKLTTKEMQDQWKAMPAKDREWGPPPPGLVRGAVGEGSPGSFHQPAERYSRRAGRLATPALDAQIHEAHEGVVGFGAGVHGTHRGDPPTRRSRLQPRNAIGRAMRQTQATGDTGGQFVSSHRSPCSARTCRRGFT